MPFIGPSAAAFTTFLMSSYLACGKRKLELDNVIALVAAGQNVGDGTHGLLQADRQVNHGHVGGGNAEGHAGQLAVEKQVFRNIKPKQLGPLVFLN